MKSVRGEVVIIVRFRLGSADLTTKMLQIGIWDG